MIDEHGKAGQQLAALAHGKGYDVPTEPSLTQKARLKALGLRDEGFDKAYAEEIAVGAHEDAVALFEKASNDVKDPDIRQFAIQTLPTLRQHLRMAGTLKQGMDKP
jgi:putative membrane protein